MRTAVVLPVRGHARLLDGCLAALANQDQALDEIVVVDDSPDASLEQLPGVTLVRSGGTGPYAARNVGWRTTDADLIFFLDARSRPRPGWVSGLVPVFKDPGVALAGSEVLVDPGASLGARASHEQQFYRLRNYLARPFFLPYLPTCNLVVRRRDLEAVEGFSEVRSGGDADFCWRVLSRPGRRLEAVQTVLMDWIPRDRARDFLEQNYRYGKSNHLLRSQWAAQGAPMAAARPHVPLLRSLLGLSARMAVALARRDVEREAKYLAWAAGVCFDVGYRIAVDRQRLTSRWRRDAVEATSGVVPAVGPDKTPNPADAARTPV
ncbi:MAG: glycosyltransferase [Janthinobacterium lividum]